MSVTSVKPDVSASSYQTLPTAPLEEHDAFIKTAVTGRLTPFFQRKVDPVQELALEEMEREGKRLPFLRRCEEEFAQRFSLSCFPYQALLEEYQSVAIAHVNKKRGLILIADGVNGQFEYSPQALSEEEEKTHLDLLTRSLHDAVKRDFNGLVLDYHELRERIQKDLAKLHQQLMYGESVKIVKQLLGANVQLKSYDSQDWLIGVILAVEQNFHRVIDDQNRENLRSLIETGLNEKSVALLQGAE